MSRTNFSKKRCAACNLMSVLMLVLSLHAGAALCAEFHISPAGSPGGDGSEGSPWDLATALNHPAAVQPGDTLWLHGGDYVGVDMNTFSSSLTGAPGNPIILRQYPGEHAVVSPTLTIGSGACVWFWGFEVMNPDPNNYGPDDYGRLPTVWLNGADDIKLINLIIHEGGQGIGCWTESENCEIYGCVLYYNGWNGSNHGHAIYMQNDTGMKYVEDNIIFGQLGTGYGIHAYGSSAAFIRNMHFEGNVAFNNLGNNILVGGGSPSDNVVIHGNFSYAGGGVRFGYSAHSVGAEITDNYFATRCTINNWDQLTVSGNTWADSDLLVRLDTAQLPSLPSYSWDFNECFYTGGGSPFNLITSSSNQWLGFSEWKAATGFDQNSAYSASGPVENRVFVRPNRYEADRAHIVVFNWLLEDGVEVDPSALLSPGDSYEVLDAENVTGPPVASGIYTGSPITVPMDTTQMAAPGSSATIVPAHSPKEFGAFVLTNTGDLAAPVVTVGWMSFSGTVSDASGCPAAVNVGGVMVPVTASGNSGTWTSADTALDVPSDSTTISTTDVNSNTAVLAVTVTQ